MKHFLYLIICFSFIRSDAQQLYDANQIKYGNYLHLPFPEKVVTNTPSKIYSENQNADNFLPINAASEVHAISLSAGVLVINEIMASNTKTIQDQDGEYDDWIELYNNTATTLTLDNVYLSDSYTSRLKWKFPDNTTIAPHGYLIVWADDDAAQPGLHSAFKLSATGEKVILSYANEYVNGHLRFERNGLFGVSKSRRWVVSLVQQFH